jgi:hypothetical protein
MVGLKKRKRKKEKKRWIGDEKVTGRQMFFVKKLFYVLKTKTLKNNLKYKTS